MTRTNNVLNIYNYLEQTNRDKLLKPKFETLPQPKEVEIIKINKKTYIERKIK